MMRIFRHGSEGFSLLGTLFEVLGILLVTLIGVSAFLSITKNGEKLVEKTEKVIEETNEKSFTELEKD